MRAAEPVAVALEPASTAVVSAERAEAAAAAVAELEKPDVGREGGAGRIAPGENMPGGGEAVAVAVGGAPLPLPLGGAEIVPTTAMF